MDTPLETHTQFAANQSARSPRSSTICPAPIVNTTSINPR